MNLDSRGGLWINGREKKEGETITAAGDEASVATENSEVSDGEAKATQPPIGEAATPSADTNERTEAAAEPAEAPMEKEEEK